jgi:hypothetical protein
MTTATLTQEQIEALPEKYRQLVEANQKFIAVHGIKTNGEFNESVLAHRLSSTPCEKCGA